MRSKAYHRLIKNVNWRHVLAFLLLGIASFDLTVVDLISPQLCEDRSGAIAGVIPTGPAKNADGRSDQNTAVKVVITDQDSLPQQDSSPASADDDCFCCCSHVLPVYSINQVTLDTMPRIDVSLIDTLPSAPPQDTFHPPRLG
jgi:hypothetical protein